VAVFQQHSRLSHCLFLLWGRRRPAASTLSCFVVHSIGETWKKRLNWTLLVIPLNAASGEFSRLVVILACLGLRFSLRRLVLLVVAAFLSSFHSGRPSHFLSTSLKQGKERRTEAGPFSSKAQRAVLII
jgi:hypothetical protein